MRIWEKLPKPIRAVLDVGRISSGLASWWGLSGGVVVTGLVVAGAFLTSLPLGAKIGLSVSGVGVAMLLVGHIRYRWITRPSAPPPLMIYKGGDMVSADASGLTGRLSVTVTARNFVVGESPTFLVRVENGDSRELEVDVSVAVEYANQVVTLPTPRHRSILAGGYAEISTKGAFTLTAESITALGLGKQSLRILGEIECEGETQHYCEKYSRFSDDEPRFVPCDEGEQRNVAISLGGVLEFNKSLAITVKKAH